MSKGKYRITITETDTGKVMMDEETSAVFAVAGIEGGFESVAGLEGCTRTKALNFLWAVDAARDCVLNDNPTLKAGYEMRDELVNKTVITDVTALEGLK